MQVKKLSELQTASSWTNKKTLVVCVKVIEETIDVKSFQFQALDPVLFHFKPGQFIGLQLEIDGEKHNRSYTIASSPSRPHNLELTIKKEKGGVVSPWLHQNISVGTKLELRGPAGRFNCFDTPSKKVLLISAGSGITPAMSMARFWSDTQADKNIVFLNWVRSVEDIIFRRELALLDHQNKHFQLEVICTRLALTENWLGRRGRINSESLNDMVPDLNHRTVFCCGPEGFMQQVKNTLQSLNFDMGNYHDESFDPGGKKKAKQVKKQAAEEQPSINTKKTELYQVKLKKLARSIDIRENENLLKNLEAAGIAIDSACRAGDCGSCQVKKISGASTTENETGLTSEQRSKGYILTCTTHVQSNIELDL